MSILQGVTGSIGAQVSFKKIYCYYGDFYLKELDAFMTFKKRVKTTKIAVETAQFCKPVKKGIWTLPRSVSCMHEGLAKEFEIPLK